MLLNAHSRIFCAAANVVVCSGAAAHVHFCAANQFGSLQWCCLARTSRSELFIAILLYLPSEYLTSSLQTLVYVIRLPKYTFPLCSVLQLMTTLYLITSSDDRYTVVILHLSVSLPPVDKVMEVCLFLVLFVLKWSFFFFSCWLSVC